MTSQHCEELLGEHNPCLLMADEVAAVESIKEAIDNEKEAGHDYGGILAVLSARIDLQLQALQELSRSSSTALANVGQPPRRWDGCTCTRKAGTRLEIQITDPHHNKTSNVTAQTAAEYSYIVSYVSSVNRVYHMMADVDARLRETLNAQAKIAIAKSAVKYPPGPTVQNHIELLQQYNEIKDIGQQLMGFVAENRGVSVASLYDSEEFGVGAHD